MYQGSIIELVNHKQDWENIMNYVYMFSPKPPKDNTIIFEKEKGPFKGPYRRKMTCFMTYLLRIFSKYLM